VKSDYAAQVRDESKQQNQTMKRYLILILFTLICVNAKAANHWYWGTVTRINTYETDGSFEIYIDNPDIQSMCDYGLVYFEVSNMGADRTRAALSLAVTAFTSGKDWGVVVDLPSSPGPCYASSTASQGAGIR
jgi:hypothetical protein